ncbi:MAG TPA: SpoIID/LytB domain-containing protein [Vicinamibacterales bacterium]|nr:SpoIID/LytB domain-containing protein [Vicinamibacterales bacterium]
MRRVLAFSFLLLAAGCASGPAHVMLPSGAARPAAPRTLRVQVREGSALVVRELALEDYVTVTALSEAHPETPDARLAERMFEVQAVVARSYAVSNRGRHAKEGFDLCSTTHCQLYDPTRLRTSRWAAAARAAAERSAGEVLWFADGPARAVFHADCGGHTSSAAAVWGGVAPAYLSGATDKVPAGAHTDWTFESRAAAVRAALNADPRTAVGARLDQIEIAGRDSAGRAEQILLRGTRTFVVRGEVFREVLTRALGVKTLKSTLFTVKKSRGDVFVFAGKGFGHGVGLCQAGALARLKAGDSPDEVLEHYFPGTSLHR